MGEALRRQEKRHWFSDDRTPARRMGVSWHPENGLMVLSLWQGNECTATFRLPIDDAARLIQILAGGLDASLQKPASTPPAKPPSWFDRVMRKVRPSLAEVIHLVDRRD